MAVENKACFLKEEIERSITVLKVKSQKNKVKNYTVNGLSILLGALITLTLGLDVPIEYVLVQKNTALIIGALLTVINGINTLSDYRSLWTRQKTTLLNLYQLKSQLEFRLSENNSYVSDLFEKYLSIWEQDGQEWKNINSRPINTIENKKME